MTATRQKPQAPAPLDVDLVLGGMAVFMLLGFVEGPFLAWQLVKIAGAVADVPRPDRLLVYTIEAAKVLVPLTLLNAALGAWIGYQLSVPLGRLRRALEAIRHGNLEFELGEEDGPLLGDYTKECRGALETLRTLVYRDRGFAEDASKALAQCAELSEGLQPAEKRKRLSELLTHARSRLHVVNEHFLKGRLP